MPTPHKHSAARAHGAQHPGLLAFLASSIVAPREGLREDNVSVPATDAAVARVDLRLGVGDLAVTAGASGLFDARFQFAGDEHRPAVSRTDSGDALHLTVADPEPRARLSDVAPADRAAWDVRLGMTTTIDLDVEIGGGRSDLDLTGIQLSRVRLKTGGGETRARFGGNLELASLEVETGAGDVTLDLAGEWHRDARVTVSAADGRTTILLPTRGVGVRVRGSGDVDAEDAPGLEREGGAFTNREWTTAPVKLDVDVTAGGGDVRLLSE